VTCNSRSAAPAAVERASVETQTELIAGGLESDEARGFLERMPTANALMPPPPPVAEVEATLEKRESAPSRRWGQRMLEEGHYGD
jgi:hypothetical protein